MGQVWKMDEKYGKHISPEWNGPTTYAEYIGVLRSPQNYNYDQRTSPLWAALRVDEQDGLKHTWDATPEDARKEVMADLSWKGMREILSAVKEWRRDQFATLIKN